MAIQEWAAKSIKAAMNKGQQALSGGKDLIGKAVGDTLDMGKQAYNQISFQPEVQPTQDQITARLEKASNLSDVASASTSRTNHINFGQGFFGTTAVASANADANGHGAFEYAVPSGFYAICTKNIKEFG